MKKMNKKMAIILIAVFLMIIVTTASGITIILFKSKENVSDVMAVSNNEKTVEVDEEGNVIDSKTGEKLSDKEIEDLKKEGKIKEDADGKIKAASDKKNEKDADKKDTKESDKNTDKKDSKIESDKKTDINNDKSDDSCSSNSSSSSSNSSSANDKSGGPDSGNNGNNNSGNNNSGNNNSGNNNKPGDNDNPGGNNTPGGNDNPGNNDPKEQACSHNWVWKTHTVHHDAVTHVENYYGEAWDEPVYATKYKCVACGAIFDTTDQASSHCAASDDDACFNWGDTRVQVDTIHHEPELLDSETIVDKEAYDEEVKDYQYCSKCGVRK